MKEIHRENKIILNANEQAEDKIMWMVRGKKKKKSE